MAAILASVPVSADPLGVDDGTHLTLWTRAATQVRADQLVQAYNARHKNQVTATYVVTDDYQTKIGAAAAANGLPDLFSADVVFMPNWTSAGLFTDITDRINSMPDIDKVAQAGIDVGTWDGKKYGMPFIADLSVWMWNKKLFKQAGLDPDKGPTSLEEFAADARAVAKLGGDVHGTFFGGSLRRLQGVHLVPDRLGRRPERHERRTAPSRISTATSGRASSRSSTTWRRTARP